MDYLDRDLELALHLAEVADELTMSRFQSANLRVEEKPDHTPVTDADRGCEDALRQILDRERPQDAVFGEEGGLRSSSSRGRQWIIDPIDGTANFLRGVPVWATLIGLAEEGSSLRSDSMVLGVVSAPALGRRWWASRGRGAWSSFGGQIRQLQVSGISRWEDASFSYSSPGGWHKLGASQVFEELTNTSWRSRAYGDFWSYMLVAEGVVDAAAEPELEVYDMAALVPIITEAGGVFTDWQAHPGPFGPNAIAANPQLHSHLVGKLSKYRAQ